LIIVRSEEAMSSPQALPSSINTVTSEYSRNQDGKVFALHSMGVKACVSRSVDEDV